MPAKSRKGTNGTAMGRVRRSDLRARQPQTDAQLLAGAKRAALATARKAEKAKRAEGEPRSFH
jgi:hypothetical protein